MKFSYIRILSIALLFIAFSASGQRVALKKADRYFELFKFDKAIKQYNKVLDKYPGNDAATLGIADCYRLLGKTEEAEQWYSEVMKQDSVYPISVYYYAQALRDNGKYDEAKKYYDMFAQLDPSDPRGPSLTESMDGLAALKADSLHYRVWNLDSMNTDAYEFGPAFYKDSIIAFVSNVSAQGRKKDVWSGGQALLNIYLAEFKDSSKVEISDIAGKVNTRYHEGPLVFNKDQSKVYFTRNVVVNGFKKEGEDDIVMLNIFSADLKDGEWRNAKPLPFNSKDYSCAYPALSADGKTLYFSSNMEGGFGGNDIWMVSEDSAGWSEPVNLGDVVNSPGNEGFLFMHEDGTLYFAGDAYEGFGGLDIYETKEENGAWSKPKNMGYPINTHFDDMGLIMNKEKTGGYLASNRDGGHGEDDIYRFDDKVTIPFKGVAYEVSVNDDTLIESRIGTLDSVLVYLYNETDGTTDTTMSDSLGNYSFILKPEKSYRLVGEKDFYFLKSEKMVSTVGIGSTDTLKYDLELYKIIGVIRLVNIYYDFDKYNIRPDAAKELDRVYELLDKYPDLEIELRSHTDCRGTTTYNDRLSSRRAKSAVQYLVKKGKENGEDLLPRVTAASFGEKMPVYADLCDTEQGLRDNEISQELADKHQVNRRTEFVVTKQPETIKVKSSIKIEAEKDIKGFEE